MANNRIYYPSHQVGFAPDGSTTFTEARGAQSVGITTTFNLEQVYQLGELKIYDNIEQIPDVEVTVEKVLDGYPLLYHLATYGATSGTLSGRSNVKCSVALSVFPDNYDSASGTPISEVRMSGMVPSSLTYTFPVDGNCTESMTLVGNDKVWRSTGFVFNGAFNNTSTPIGSGGTQQRDNVVFVTPPSGTSKDVNGQYIYLGTFLPTEIDGVGSGGIKGESHPQSITISTDLGRDQIFELGRKAPYFRYVTFPVEVTTEITMIATKWDGISGTELGGQNGAAAGSNLKNQSIRVYTMDGTFISTGQSNKLSNVTYGGGDAGGGGGNVTVTYRYSTFNELIVRHPADPTTALVAGAI